MVGLLRTGLALAVSSSLFVSYLCQEESFLSFKSILALSFLIVYWLYYSTYRSYLYEYNPPHPGTVRRGKTPPCYPNGWFMICKSKDLKPSQAIPIKKSDYDIVLFRGENGEAYALHAFCPHSGANLGVGGQIKHGSCVQCPFHGWLFDGKTGTLVSGETLKPRKVVTYSYNEKLGTCLLKPEDVLVKRAEGPVTVRKYILKEINGFIYIWLHSDPEAKPEYFPLDLSDIQKRLVHKGVSMNKIYSHCQDIVENGGDVRHFVYVHSYLLPFTNLFGGIWDAKWFRGDDPELRTKMAHKIPWVNQHKQRLFDQYLDKTNSKYIGVMYLDMYMKVLNFKPLFFFNATVFQVGPGLVYLFLISPYYEAVFFQHTSTLDKYEHDVFHELYASGYLPHFFTALMLRLEAQQVTNDTFIWNNKEFASNPKYNLDADADVMILTWRRWFSQFYEGCAQREAEISKYSW